MLREIEKRGGRGGLQALRSSISRLRSSLTHSRYKSFPWGRVRGTRKADKWKRTSTKSNEGWERSATRISSSAARPVQNSPRERICEYVVREAWIGSFSPNSLLALTPVALWIFALLLATLTTSGAIVHVPVLTRCHLVASTTQVTYAPSLSLSLSLFFFSLCLCLSLALFTHATRNSNIVFLIILEKLIVVCPVNKTCSDVSGTRLCHGK